MTVNLSIKNVPDALAEKLRRRAVGNHRSLQGELMALLESSLAVSRASQEPAAYVVSSVVRENAAANDAAHTRNVATLRQIWEQARAERPTKRGDEDPTGLQLLHEARVERSEQLMTVIAAPDAYARARALLGLPAEKSAKPQAGVATANPTPGRNPKSTEQPRRARTPRAKHG